MVRMMGRWCDCNCASVLHIVFCDGGGEQKVMSEEERL